MTPSPNQATEQPVPPSETRMVFRAVREDRPGARLAAIFGEYRGAYRRWIARGPAVTADEGIAALRAHMPELMPTFDDLMSRLGGGDEEARLLSLWRPPRLVRACSQLVLHVDDGPVLVRNYDHAPHLCDGLILRSAWGGVSVIAPTDCLWGALDGINGHGLAIALAFGGRPVVGDGFSAALLARYVLQACGTVQEAREALARVPIAMAYTFVATDRSGEFVTAYCSPDRAARFERTPVSTNHQDESEWSRYVELSNSVGRLQRLREMESMTVDAAVRAFLEPPLYRTDYAGGSGTLYTSVLDSAHGAMAMHWPDHAATFTLDSFVEGDYDVRLGPPVPGDAPA